MEKLDEVRSALLSRVAEVAEPRSVLRSTELRELYGIIATLPSEERGAFGKKVNELKQELRKRSLVYDELCIKDNNRAMSDGY